MPIEEGRLLYFFHWAAVAIDQEARAREGRKEQLRLQAAGMLPSTSELHAAMIAIAACSHSLDDVEAWRPRLKALFEDLRNPVVHPKVRMRPTVEHPALAIEVDADQAVYTVEAVEESVDLLIEILAACAEAPKPSVEDWAIELGLPGIGLSGLVAFLKSHRARLRTTSEHDDGA